MSDDTRDKGVILPPPAPEPPVSGGTTYVSTQAGDVLQGVHTSDGGVFVPSTSQTFYPSE